MSNGPNARAFEQAVQTKISGGMTRAAAIRAVAIGEPDLHAAYLDEVNQRSGPSITGTGISAGRRQAMATAGGFDFAAAVDRHVADGKSRAEAIKLAAAEDPDMPGHQPVSNAAASAGGYGCDAIADFQSAVAEKMADGMTKAQATLAAVKEDSARHAAYIEQYNQRHSELRR
jgi:hypothetical protein